MGAAEAGSTTRQGSSVIVFVAPFICFRVPLFKTEYCSRKKGTLIRKGLLSDLVES